MATHRGQVEAMLAGAAAEHAALLDHVSPAMRASLPVDATGIAQAIEHLAAAVGRSDEVRREQALAHRANPAVLHGRVFGRAPLPPDTVVASFVEGARVRARALRALAGAIGGPALEAEIAGLLERHPADSALAPGDLVDAYAAQEQAALRLAARLDEG